MIPSTATIGDVVSGIPIIPIRGTPVQITDEIKTAVEAATGHRPGQFDSLHYLRIGNNKIYTVMTYVDGISVIGTGASQDDVRGIVFAYRNAQRRNTTNQRHATPQGDSHEIGYGHGV